MHGRNIKSGQKFGPGTPGGKTNAVTNELKRILPNCSCQVLYLNQEAAMHEGVVSTQQITIRLQNYPIPTQCRLLTPLGNKRFENTVGKGEIARNEQFLLFPQCFLPIWITFCHFHQI